MSPRDISGRVLSRPLRSPYGRGHVRSRMRWLWLAGLVWLVWAAFISEHGFLRIGRLRRELSGARTELRRVQAENAALDARLADPRERTEHAEALLRAQGMARPGEIIYRLGGARADSGAAAH